MTIRERMESLRAHTDFLTRNGVPKPHNLDELADQLTRVLALIEAAGVVRKSLHAAEQEKYDECKWDALEGTQSLADAFDALVAAGDIEVRRTPAPALGPWTKVSEIDCRTESGDIEEKATSCRGTLPKEPPPSTRTHTPFPSSS